MLVEKCGDLQFPCHQLHDVCMRQWRRCSVGILEVFFLIILGRSHLEAILVKFLKCELVLTFLGSCHTSESSQI